MHPGPRMRRSSSGFTGAYTCACFSRFVFLIHLHLKLLTDWMIGQQMSVSLSLMDSKRTGG